MQSKFNSSWKPWQHFSAVLIYSLQNYKFDNMHNLSNQNLHIKGNLLFESNVAEKGPGIFVSDWSNVTFGIYTYNVKFAHNAANVNGGAIYINNWSTVAFENHSHTVFYSNRARSSGGNVYAYNNSGIMVQSEQRKFWWKLLCRRK